MTFRPQRLRVVFDALLILAVLALILTVQAVHGDVLQSRQQGRDRSVRILHAICDEAAAQQVYPVDCLRPLP